MFLCRSTKILFINLKYAIIAVYNIGPAHAIMVSSLGVSKIKAAIVEKMPAVKSLSIF